MEEIEGNPVQNHGDVGGLTDKDVQTYVQSPDDEES